MGSPHYFFRGDPEGDTDKRSPDVMQNRLQITERLLALIDRLTPAQMRAKR